MKFNNQHLTPGEVFHLWLRQSGLTDEQVGEMFSVCSRTVRNWQRDRNLQVPDMRSEICDPIPAFRACYVLRRRLGLNARQFARTFGVSFQTLCRWENGEGDYQRLITYFNQLGWEFDA